MHYATTALGWAPSHQHGWRQTLNLFQRLIKSQFSPHNTAVSLFNHLLQRHNVDNRLKYFLEINNILSVEQNGFRPERCCQDHIFSLTSITVNRMLSRKDTFACFIDFRKAFDCVNREMLGRRQKHGTRLMVIS